jgi:hypothetical protein
MPNPRTTSGAAALFDSNWCRSSEIDHGCPTSFGIFPDQDFMGVSEP